MNSSGVRAHSLSRFTTYVQRRWALYVMLIPAFVLLLIFSYLPMYGVVVAFQKFNPAIGFFNSPWVGWANFERLFNLPNFWQLVKNTLMLSVGKIITIQLFAITFAILLDQATHTGFRRAVQSMVYLPYFLSWIVMGGIIIDILSPSGMVNQALVALGLERIIFLGSNVWFQPTILITNLWKDGGWATIIYLAALTGIDTELYSAAAVDGAGRWGRIWHVSLPGILPIIILVACLNLGNVLNAGFEQIITLYNPVVYRTGDVLDTFVYRSGILQAQYGLAGALGLVKSFISMALILTSWWLVQRYSNFRIF